MEAETALVLPKFRTYGEGDRAFYLAKGLVTENNQPKTSISRWDSEQVLRELEKQYGVPEGTLRLPSLYESHTAARQDPEVRQSIFSWPAEWQRTFVLNPNGQTETPKYVLMDDQEKVLQPSGKPRSFNPIRTYIEGDKNIVVANVFDIPFDLVDSRYNPEDLDPTGFLERLNPQGQYGIWFGSNPSLYAVILREDGRANCLWEPSASRGFVGLRGVSGPIANGLYNSADFVCKSGNAIAATDGNLSKELLESEEDDLLSKLRRSNDRIGSFGSEVGANLDELERTYVSGLEALRRLKSKREQ